MLGVIYLMISVLLGYHLTKRVLVCSNTEGKKNENRIWLYLPAAIGVGLLVMGWITYLSAWVGKVYLEMKQPLVLGNIVSLAGALCVIAGFFYKEFTQEGKVFQTERWITNKKRFIIETIFFAVLLCFINWIFFYVFHVIDGRLYSGFTVFGDYAPHTAMMRSFSMETNYPTGYPHYGGADVKYHFMFQFLTGNLEYLGMRLDVAYNVVSLLVLEGFLMLLYMLAQRIVKSTAAGIITVFLFFFRSSFSFWIYAWENWKAGNLWDALTKNTVFIGYTPNEDWGLWNFNVYLNQRHLGMGLLLAALAIWIYMDWMEESLAKEEKGFLWLNNRLFTKEAWMWKRPGAAVFAGLILGACSFWNGAAVIGGLLILFGFAACSDGKLDYALTALIAVVLSMFQSKMFIDGSVMKVSFYWGFIAEDKTFPGVLKYILIVSGIFFVGLIIPALAYKRRERVLMFAFLLPTLFAFTISLTPDVTVNHKYVMISYAFLTIFWAGLLVKLWKQFALMKVTAVILTVMLSITGIYDLVVILLDNDEGHRVSLDLNSTTTEWLSENLEQDDLLLTPQYSMNEVTMSGVMLYSGWPYYAWSAGYDTYYRAGCATEIYTSNDPGRVRELLEQEKITYIVYEEGMEYEQQECREDIIARICTRVFISEDGRIRIYEA